MSRFPVTLRPLKTLVWVAVFATACSLETGCSFDPGGFAGSSGDGGAGAPDARPNGADASDVDARPPGAPDASPVGSADATPACAAPSAGAVGASCSSDGACSGGGFCLNGPDEWPDSGYCTHVCDSDDDCGANGRCSQPIGTGGTRVCFSTCCGGGTCGRGGIACTDTLGSSPTGFDACLPGDASAADGDSCSTFGDCAPSSVCNDNPFEAPGGYCVTVGCTPGNDATCASAGDGVCVDDDLFDSNPAFCVDRCTSTGQCRTGDDYECVSIGIGTSVCTAPHQDPGSGCGSDGQCGADPWQCLTGEDFPNGYCSSDECTGDDDECPAGSFCGRVGDNTFCVAECEPGPVACRFLEGYECISFGMGFNGCINQP